MTIRSGLFDSTALRHDAWGFPVGNKAQTADFFAEVISSLVSDGLLAWDGENDPFRVSPSGRNLTVEPGKAFIRGYFCFDDACRTLTLAQDSDAHTYEVLLRLDLLTGEIRLELLTDYEGEELPVRWEYICDLWLATVTVPAGAASVTADMIEDHRADAVLCGFSRALKHSTAERLETPRTISLVGAVSGAGQFDGSEDTEISVSSVDLSEASGILPLNRGGTGAANSIAARANLGAAAATHVHTAAEITGGTFGGAVRMEEDEGGSDYTDFHLRDICLRSTVGTSVKNGAVILVHQ